MNKRGDIGAISLGLGIIFLISAVSLFYYFTHLNVEKNIDKTVCENSIALRSSPLADKFIPINCKTKKTCVSEKGNSNCGDAFVLKSSIDKLAAKSEDDINKVLAEEMYYVWDEVGRGKLNFMPNDKFWSSNFYCFIGSKIVFDESIKQKYKDGIYGLDRYLDTHTHESDEETYTQMFTGGSINKAAITDLKIGEFGKDTPISLGEALDPTHSQITTIPEYRLNPQDDLGVIYIITKPGQWTKSGVRWGGGIAGTGAAIVVIGAAVTIFSAGTLSEIGIPMIIAGTAGALFKVGVGGALIKTGLTTGFISYMSKGEDSNHELTIVKYDLEALRKAGCTNWETVLDETGETQ